MILAILASTPQSDFLQNPIFQFIVNVIISVSAIIIAIWVYKKQQRKKELSYEVVSEAPVISIGESVANRVKIEFDGHPVKEVTLVVLKITNTGNTAIKKDDYEEPLTFVFKGRRVLSCEVVETEPDDLIDDVARKIFLQVPASTQESLEFPKFLLNPKQSITFSILLDGAQDEISKKGRIIDGEIKHEIKQMRWPESNAAMPHPLFFIGLGMIASLVLWLLGSSIFESISSSNLIFISFACITAIILYFTKKSR